MTQDIFIPGAILHDAVMGAFKARGASFEVWCSERGIYSTAARSATYGQSRGPKGSELLREIIDAAGRDVVRTAYVARVVAHAGDLSNLGANQ
ncbi:hypothetical protein EBL89_18240 [Cereibacter sphaeroides]|uniref:hypothetical protein n=1 Tax=Cereibacter sphaeroides TaxID=1063 RepID=UPI000F51EDDA|nr:hypothetical protein [Cereibacter sphaeroides]AZB57233.1 hypothetical protein EBL89_18240 [Cereibacter sphaeroides]AZB61517.1 hypothetical protein EBL88_18350 [Cereibacter sphaeroides]